MGNEVPQKKKTFSKKQMYAIAKNKEMMRRTSMCIAEDKNMGVKYYTTLREDLTLTDKNGKPVLTPIFSDTDTKTAYLRALNSISIFYPNYKQCCTGMSSAVRNSIVIDVDDDYTVAEKRLEHIREITDGKFPVPTFKVINTKTNHIQYMFILRDSLPYEEETDKFPYQRVTRIMNAVIGGDLNFRFYQCKNPLSQNPSLRTITNLPETIDGFLPFSYFMELTDLLENLDEQSLESETYELLQQAKEMNRKKFEAINKPKNEKKTSNSNRTSDDEDNDDAEKLGKIAKNIDKVNRNEAYKNKIDLKKKYKSSRNVLAKDYARKFVWYCMLNDISVDAASTAQYLMSKNSEICQKVGKDELLSDMEIDSTARCTYYWCLANFDKEKAKNGSFSDLQRLNSITMRRDKAYFLAKECIRLKKNGCGISEISNRLLIHRNTVRNYLNSFDRLFKEHCRKRQVDRNVAQRRREYRKNRQRLDYLNAKIAHTPQERGIVCSNLFPIYKFFLNFNLNKFSGQYEHLNGEQRSLFNQYYNNQLCKKRIRGQSNGCDPPT